MIYESQLGDIVMSVSLFYDHFDCKLLDR